MTTWTRLTTLWQRVGPRARDVTFIVVALLASVADGLARRQDGAAVAVGALLVGLAGTVALWWRRSHPVVVTGIGIAVFAAVGLPITMAVGLFSLAIRRRDRVLAAMTLAVAAAFAIATVLDSSTGWVGAIGLGVLEAGFCAAAGSYVGARRDLVAALRDRAVRAEAEQELRAEQAMLAERSRIAREMHDVLAHKVSLIAMHAGALEVNPAAGPDQVERTAALIRTTAHEAMDDLRDVLGVLRGGDGRAEDGSDLAPQPRRADIERLVEASRSAGVDASLTMSVGDLPDPVARTVHRIVREALTNVHKHARGATTSVAVGGDEAVGVTVEVVNRRPVAAAQLLPGTGSGLVGLRERVALAGGTFECGPCPDGGWRLAAWLPWALAPGSPVDGDRT